MSRSPTTRRRVQLALLCAAQFVLVLDVVVVNVALPSIRADLVIADARLPLVGVAYTLPFGALLIVSGRAGDVLGRRRLLLTGLVVFGAASLLAGAATSQWALFGGRAAQGVGAAMVSPAALSLVLAAFPEGPGRNRAMGVWGAVGSAGAIAGQVLGGALVSWVGWRAIFLINVPVVVLVVVGAAWVIADPRDRPAGQRLDLRGAALLTGSLTALIMALVGAAERGVDGLVWALMALAVGGLLTLWRVEAGHPAPLVERRVLRARPVRLGNAVLAINAGVLTAALFFTTLHLQVSLGMSPLAVGLAFAPVTVIVLVISPLAGRLLSRHGVRRLVVTGSLAGTAGLLWLARVPADGTSLADVMPGLALLAVMGGLSFAPSFVAGTSGIQDADHGLASGLLSTSQEVGAAVGLAALSAVAAAGGGTAQLGPAGQRAGFLGAALLCIACAAIASRAPRRLGTAEAAAPGEPTPALVGVGGDR